MNEIVKHPLLLMALIVASVECSAVFGQAEPDSAAASLVRVDGLVFEHQKYSFTMRGLDRDYRIVIPNGIPLLMKLTLPEIDFEQKTLAVQLLVSAPDGNPQNNRHSTYPLSDPVYVMAEFDDQQQMDQAFSKPVRTFEKYTLSPQPFPASPFSIQGVLLAGREPGQFLMKVKSEIFPVTLGPRKGLMLGAKVTDLHPHETEVFVEGAFEGESLVASSIRFQHIGDPFARFDAGLPNGLIIGDQISIGYDPALREALAGKMNIHHPPTNCGGAENCRDIHRWVSNPNRTDRCWDVVAFNFGLQDINESESVWKDNLRNAVKALEKTGAKLVWINSTPMPQGLAEPYAGNQPLGMVQGRMRLQNQWAADVLHDFPEVETCDLSELVTQNADGIYDEWLKGKAATFNGLESAPLGRAVASSMMQAAGLSGDKQ